MNQIVSLFMFSCGDYEKVKQDVWEENWKAMRLYSVVALVAFGVITLVSVFSLSIGKYKWVYLVYTFLSLAYFCISRCQLRSFLGKELVVYSFFAALLLFGIITGTLITPEELTVNYIVFMMVAPLLFTARTAVMNGLILSSMLLYIGLAFFAEHNPILSKNLADVILYGVLSMFLTATMMRSKLQRILYQILCQRDRHTVKRRQIGAGQLWPPHAQALQRGVKGRHAVHAAQSALHEAQMPLADRSGLRETVKLPRDRQLKADAVAQGPMLPAPRKERRCNVKEDHAGADAEIDVD